MPPGPPARAQDNKSKAKELLDSGRVAEAESLLRRMVQASANDGEVQFLMGACLFMQGKQDHAFVFAQRAVALAPNHAKSHNLLGQCLMKRNKREEAVTEVKRSVELDPSDAQNWNAYGAMLLLVERSEEAMQPLARAYELEPLDPSIANNYGRVLSDHARPDLCCQILDKALKAHQNELMLLTNFVPMLNYPSGVPKQVRLGAASTLGKMVDAAAAGKVLHRVTDFDPERPLRVGILSYDFRAHSCSFFFRPILKHLDRAQVDLHCFNCFNFPDRVTDELRGLAPHWHDVSRLNVEQTAQAIADQKIDILLETGGWTSGARVQTLAYRPAPAQGSFLGYPTTTGMRSIGYRIVDGVTDPVGTTPDPQEMYCEKLVRMDGCFLCYDPGPHAPTPRAAPEKRPDEPITFGCFSATTKISASTLRLWADVLNSVPDSRLFLKGWSLGGTMAPEYIRRELAKRGVDGARVECMGRTGAQDDHLRMYDRMDIALDTVPYVGTTTTCEAMLMGVPMVSFAGTEHVSRVGLTLLKQVGLEHLVATSPEQYVAIAKGLAADRARLADLHATLRQRLLASPLCDGATYCRNFERALREVWRDRCAAKPSP
jgi:predicted O-linked N-acetylglucosamine transferase (SPINDLY family)